MIDAQESVVLVDEKNRAVGTMDKLQAHVEGRLHRAFSVFLIDDTGRLLLQQRAASKYHSAGLWTNACCSHPRLGESIAEAAARRLGEEMGIVTALREGFSFIYRAELTNGLIEHELDHVLFGVWNGPATPNPDEVSDWRYMSIESLDLDLQQYPERYTAWLRACWEQVLNHLGHKRK